MTTLEDVRSITARDLTTIVGSFIATIAPGILILNFYSPELVVELESIKLILLSGAITLPVLVINSFVMLIAGMVMEIWSKDIVKGHHLFFYQAVWAFLVLYSTLLFAYLCDFGIEKFVLVGVLMDVVVGLGVVALFRLLANATS